MADTKSPTFHTNARKIEKSLGPLYVKKMPFVLGVKVLSLTKGSVVVDYTLVVNKTANVTGSQVESDIKSSLAGDNSTGFNVNVTYAPVSG